MATHYVASPNVESIRTTINGVTNDTKLSSYYVSLGVFAPKPYDGDDAQKAVVAYDFARDSAAFAFQRSEDALPLVKALQNGSIYPQYVNSINKIESASTVKTSTAIRDGQFNLSTGKFSPGYPQTSTDSFGNDNAARSSFDIPGSLTYMAGASTPVSQNYEAKG